MKAVCIKDNLMEAINVVQKARAFLIAAGEKMHPVSFDISGDKLVISCETEFGEVKAELPVAMEGCNMNISFNPVLFLDTLRAIDDERIELSFVTNHGPCIIRPVGYDEFIYVIAGRVA